MLAIIITAIAALLVMVGSAEATAPRRVALVVGNEGYRSLSPLHNPALDARALANQVRRREARVLRLDSRGVARRTR